MIHSSSSANSNLYFLLEIGLTCENGNRDRGLGEWINKSHKKIDNNIDYGTGKVDLQEN